MVLAYFLEITNVGEAYLIFEKMELFVENTKVFCKTLVKCFANTRYMFNVGCFTTPPPP